VPLAPVIKTALAPGDCWHTRTADGVWGFDRTEEPTTPWEIFHLPSVADGSWTLPVVTCPSMRACRALVASGGAADELAMRLTSKTPEVCDMSGRVPGTMNREAT